MTEHPAPALLVTARSTFEADILIGILEEAGIPAYRAGSQLTDGFAMSQQLMNTQGVQVFVPGDRLEQAREAIAQSEEAGKLLAEDTDEDEDP